MEASIDKTTVTTELAKTEQVTVNLKSVNGYAGDVTLAASLTDATDAALPNVTLTGPTTVTLAADGTGTAEYEIAVPMNATGSVLNGTLKVAVTSSGGNKDLSSTVTVNNIYTVDYAAGTGNTTANHMNIAGTPNLVVKRGAIIRFHNSDTIDHIIHGNDPFPHENQTPGVGGIPGRNYDVQTIGIPPGTSATMGCHSHPGANNATYATYRVE